MKKIRIIPRLDVKGHNVVKGIHMEGLRVMGSPVDLAKKYYEQGADELVYMDIVASLYERNIDFELVKAVANELFIPMTVGGGIRSLDDINDALRVGADKVAINTFATKNPEFLRDAVHQFGSQCIVLSVEAKCSTAHPSGWEVYTDGGREHSGRDVAQWIQEALTYEIGEVMLTSVDFDGTRKGYDLELIETISPNCPVPLVVYGGAKNAQSMQNAVSKGKVDGLACASMLYYDEWTISNLKKELRDASLPIRA
jgi:cyclase